MLALYAHALPSWKVTSLAWQPLYHKTHRAFYLGPHYCYLRQLYDIRTHCVKHVLELVYHGNKSLHVRGVWIKLIKRLFSWWSQSHSMSLWHHHCNNTHWLTRRQILCGVGICSSPMWSSSCAGWGKKLQYSENIAKVYFLAHASLYWWWRIIFVRKVPYIGSFLHSNL